MSTPFVCIQIGLYSISFGFAWGPIGWLVPSEIHDLNTRSAGQSITVFTQLVSGAIVTQSMFLVTFGHTMFTMLFTVLLSAHFESACNFTPVLSVHCLILWGLLWVCLGAAYLTFCCDHVLALPFACVLMHSPLAQSVSTLCVCVCSLFEHAVLSKVGHLHLLWILAICCYLLRILLGP